MQFSTLVSVSEAVQKSTSLIECECGANEMARCEVCRFGSKSVGDELRKLMILAAKTNCVQPKETKFSENARPVGRSRPIDLSRSIVRSIRSLDNALRSLFIN